MYQQRSVEVKCKVARSLIQDEQGEMKYLHLYNVLSHNSRIFYLSVHSLSTFIVNEQEQKMNKKLKNSTYVSYI